jgi:hypothetical protein
MSRRHQGFVLLEALPALVLLLALLGAALRLTWTAALARDHGAGMELTEAGLNEACAFWRTSGGEVVLARRGAGGAWRLNGFPDLSWLPPAEAAGDPAARVYRRETWQGPDGARYWRVFARGGAQRGRAAEWRLLAVVRAAPEAVR